MAGELSHFLKGQQLPAMIRNLQKRRENRRLLETTLQWTVMGRPGNCNGDAGQL